MTNTDNYPRPGLAKLWDWLTWVAVVALVAGVVVILVNIGRAS